MCLTIDKQLMTLENVLITLLSRFQIKPRGVECSIGRISCSDNTRQAALGLVRANTNTMKEDFDLASSTLIEINPYYQSQRSTSTKSGHWKRIFGS